MRKNNKRLLSMLALILAFGQLDVAQVSAQAAANSEQSAKPAASQPAAPTVIEADQVYFSDKSGDMSARGNVKITQNQDTILTDYMRGNQKQTMIWVDGIATLIQPDTKLTGSGLAYNYSTKTGSVDQARAVITKERPVEDNAQENGKLKQEFLTGQKVTIAPDYLTAQNATYTGCELQTPDYHISADKVEVWPGNKLIAHNAKFWIKDTVIFSLPKYEVPLKGNVEGGAFPSIGYSSDNGVYIRQNLSYPINPTLSVYTNLAYYNQAGFRPQYGIKWDKSDYYLQVEFGDYYDDDVWIEKRPEYKFGIPKRRIGNLPVSFQFTASYGKWTEENITSWHQDYSLYFTHDTVTLDSDKTLKLGLGTGLRHIRDSANDSVNTVWRYDATLSKKWSPKFSTFVANHYTEAYDSLFTYDEPDVYNELAYGFSYVLNDRNTIALRQSYDLDNSELFSRTYSWKYSMHCWLLDFNHTNYTDGRDEKWRVKVDTNF